MRSTSFFLNPTESTNRQLRVFRMSGQPQFDRDSRQISVYFVERLDDEFNIHGGSALAADYGLEVVVRFGWTQGQCGIAFYQHEPMCQMRVLLPFKEEMVLRFCDGYALRTDGVLRAAVARLYERLFQLRRAKTGTRAIEKKRPIQKSMVLPAIKAELGDWLDTDIINLPEAV